MMIEMHRQATKSNSKRNRDRINVPWLSTQTESEVNNENLQLLIGPNPYNEIYNLINPKGSIFKQTIMKDKQKRRK